MEQARRWSLENLDHRILFILSLIVCLLMRISCWSAPHLLQEGWGVTWGEGLLCFLDKLATVSALHLWQWVRSHFWGRKVEVSKVLVLNMHILFIMDVSQTSQSNCCYFCLFRLSNLLWYQEIQKLLKQKLSESSRRKINAEIKTRS